MVSGLNASVVVQIACGTNHSMALDEWGQVFAWGSDAEGQLGHGLSATSGNTIQATPKIIKNLATNHTVQIACGAKHSIALTSSGDIYVWGLNSDGQLGLGSNKITEIKPVQIASLSGIPLAFIACGKNHTFAISKSGAVFGWGKNDCGQLGLNDTSSRAYPCQLRTLRNIKVRYISCGDDFSMFLTLDGGVFTCGAGSYGQLGHGSNSNEILPRQVIELMGSTISQIACGRQHSLALVPSRGRVYSFGQGGAGQLGRKKTGNTSTPQVVLGPWMSPSGVSTIPTEKKVSVSRIFAGGDHCFVTVQSMSSDYICDFRDYRPGSQILEIDKEHLSKCLKYKPSQNVEQDLIGYIEVVFKSLNCINGSFLLPHNKHYYCTSKHHGIDVQAAETLFSIIAKFENQSIKDLILSCISQDVLRSLISSPPDVEALRAYITLPLYHEFSNPKQHSKLHAPFAAAVLRLKTQANRVVSNWWSMTNSDYFERLVNVFKNVVSYLIRLQNPIAHERGVVSYDPTLVSMLDMLSYLNKLNHSVEGLKVSYDTFHVVDLCDLVDVRIDYITWLSDTSGKRFFLCNYPFIFDAPAKVQLLQTDQRLQMHTAMSQAAHQALISLLFSQVGHVNQFLELNVSREHIVSDTLRELSSVSTSDLKKPLKVKFYGEEAEDAGGVSKEFFLLVLKEILDMKYGMFREYEETRAIWFSEDTFEEEAMYFLIGLICGLAIYNFTIIAIPFPLALYKKLLKEPVGLADLKGLSPMLVQSLQQLLDYDGTDEMDVFCLTFSLTRDVYGEVRTIPLKPNGENIPVTHENKEEYVKLYVDFILNKSVSKHFNAFRTGFMKVCGGRVLELFHSHELMGVVVGNENYDWHALEEAADYRGGYTSSDKTIRWFWEVLHDMTLEDKKKFLFFLTGSDRIPIQGMKAIKITIQPTQDDRFLPVAHTCFNLLDLPRYKTKEKLKYKLVQAIQQTQGFSLV